MNADEVERMMALFAEAADYPPDQQAAFLTRACPDDAALRQEVAALLRCQAEADRFLEEPAFGHGLEVLQRAAGGELQAGDTVGECRVVSLLGVGGMGEVYLAEDTIHHRPVALKLIGQGRAEETRGRHFRHERKVLATLNHPHIARLYGSGVTAKGQAYLVMEYVEGERLDRFCQERGLDVPARLALFRKVCAAVAYAHQNLVVHRDLKPANIRVTPEGEPKLLDFGIAKLLDPEGTTARLDPTVTMQGAMTPEYASPEQLKGEVITTGSDVYSLGVVLFELLTGQRPFAHLKSRRPDELARAVCEEEPPRPSTVAGQTTPTTATVTLLTGSAAAPQPRPATVRRQLEGDLDNIIAKTLRKEPARRYASVAAFSEDLRRHGDGLPVSARKDTLRYRAGKFVRRNKVGVAAASFVTVALVGGLVTTTWQVRIARQERDHVLIAQRQSARLNIFLQDLLLSSDPAKMGKDVKVVEVLDASSKNLDRDLGNEPELLAQAHETLSRAYLRLGVMLASEEHARAALAIFRRLHGDDDPVTALSKDYLVDALVKRNRYDEMLALSSQAVAVLRRQPAVDNYDLARALLLWGVSLAYTLHPQEAEPALIEGLRRMREARGEVDADYVYGLRCWSILQWVKQDDEGMEATCRRLIALADQLSPGSTETLTTEVNLCNGLFVQGKLTEMEATLRRLEPECRQKVGESNRFYGLALYMISLLGFTRGDYPGVILQERQCLEIMTSLWANNDYHIVMGRALLGLALTRTGDAPAGEPLLRAALADGKNMDRFSQVIGPRFFDLTFGNLGTALGECLLVQKRYAEAEPLLLTGHDDLEKRLGVQNRLTIQATRRLHDLYLAWNKPAEVARFADNATAQPSPTP